MTFKFLPHQEGDCFNGLANRWMLPTPITMLIFRLVPPKKRSPDPDPLKMGFQIIPPYEKTRILFCAEVDQFIAVQFPWRHFFQLFKVPFQNKNHHVFSPRDQQQLLDLQTSLYQKSTPAEIESLIQQYLRQKWTTKYTDQYFIDRALALLSEDPLVWNSKRLAQKLKVSDKHLRQTFQRQVGISPKKYLQILRIRMAIRHLILKKFEKIGDLAHTLGYADAAHFSNAFKQMIGLGPRAFLKIYRKGILDKAPFGLMQKHSPKPAEDFLFQITII